MKLRLKAGAGFMAVEDILFILYFCSNIFIIMLSRILGSSVSRLVYILLFFGLIFFHSLKFGAKYLAWPIIVYTLVAFLFLITALLHPEYDSWFSHEIYGIVPALLNPTKGIWAFLVVFLLSDEKKMTRDLKLVCILLFLFNLLRYIVAVRRGYWVIYDVSGQTLHRSYNLEFGYEMMFPTAFMGAYAFLKKKRGYYVLFAIGMYTILMGGSRGAIIWPIVMFPLMLPFLWKNIEKKKRGRVALLYTILIIVAVLVYINYNVLLGGLVTLLRTLGLESRTITAVLSGTAADSSGREEIYRVAIDMIKNGGPFGWGVYGDRYVISRVIRWAIWGYCHNLFLEIMVSFGYFLGTLICVLIIKSIFELYSYCDNEDRQVVFITFLVASFKLILSNSFWYTAAFWAIYALAIKWRKKPLINIKA